MSLEFTKRTLVAFEHTNPVYSNSKNNNSAKVWCAAAPLWGVSLCLSVNTRLSFKNGLTLAERMKRKEKGRKLCV